MPFGINTFLDEGGDDMGGLGIEIITGAIEIHGQQENGIKTILLPIRLRLYQHHLLGEAIGGIRLFGITVPEIVLLKGDRREFRVGTDRSQGDKFFQFVEVALVDQLDAHHDVFIEESAGILPIEADATHFGGQMNDNVRLCLFVEPFHIVALNQIVLGQIGDSDIVISFILQSLNEVFPQEAFAAGYGDAVVVHGDCPERTGSRIKSGMTKLQIATALRASQ